MLLSVLPGENREWDGEGEFRRGKWREVDGWGGVMILMFLECSILLAWPFSHHVLSYMTCDLGSTAIVCCDR